VCCDSRQAKLNQNRPAVDKSTPALVPYHPILGSFPGCAKTVGPTSVLCISGLNGKDSRGASFLGGSFPLPYLPETQQMGFERVLSNAQPSSNEKTPHTRNARPTTDEIMIAEASSAAKSYLDMILRSIQACQGIWRDDIDKEHDRWVDELEDAARTHGSMLISGQAAQAKSVNLLSSLQSSQFRIRTCRSDPSASNGSM